MRNNSLLLCAALAALPSFVSAAVFPYGDKVGATIIYRSVTEDTSGAIALYGNPDISGNALVFDPTNFAVTSSGGTPQFVDSTLTTTIEAKSGQYIQKVSFVEAGDYSLIGNGTIATSATVVAPYYVRVTEIAGVPVAPILYTGTLNFTPSNGDYFLPAEAGSGIFVGSTLIDVDAIIAGAGLSGKATKVYFNMDNKLIATSETGTISFIKKKTADAVTITVFPEPVSLTALAGVSMLVVRRRR